jgi:hypothetical protein
VIRAIDIPSLEPFNPVLDIAQSFQFQRGKFVEEISEVESFFGLDAINTLCKPVDVKGSERGGVIACRSMVPGMRPEMYRPAVTMVVPFYVAAVVKPFLRLFSFLYSCFKEPFAIGRTCIAHLSHASSYKQAAPLLGGSQDQKLPGPSS